MKYSSGFSKIKLSLTIPLAYKGAGIALFREDNGKTYVLLGKRTFNPGRGKWTFPGGGFDSADKTLDRTACREFYEETHKGIGEFCPKKVGEVNFNFGVWKWRTLILKATTQPKGSKVKKQYSEFSSLKWININNLHKYKLHYGVNAVVKEYFLKNKSRLPKFTDLHKIKTFSFASYKSYRDFNCVGEEYKEFLNTGVKKDSSYGCLYNDKPYRKTYNEDGSYSLKAVKDWY